MKKAEKEREKEDEPRERGKLRDKMRGTARTDAQVTRYPFSRSRLMFPQCRDNRDFFSREEFISLFLLYSRLYVLSAISRDYRIYVRSFRNTLYVCENNARARVPIQFVKRIYLCSPRIAYVYRKDINDNISRKTIRSLVTRSRFQTFAPFPSPLLPSALSIHTH